MIKAVIFDMDGVVINSQPIANRLLEATCKNLGVFLTKKELSNLTGASGRRFWEYVKQTYNLPKDISYYQSLYNEDLEISEYKSLSVDKELVNLLGFLSKNKIKIAIASSASKKRMEAVLDQFGIKKYFTVRICDSDVSKSKPDPEIYLLAAEKLKLDPYDCAAVEDTDSGILASTKAGMKCFLCIKYTPVGGLCNKAIFTSKDFSVLEQKIKSLL